MSSGPSITLSLTHPRAYARVTEEFETTCTAAGIPVLRSPQAKVKLAAGEAHTLILSLDPETVKLLFKYLAATAVTLKTAGYVHDFLEAIVSTLGNNAGAQVSKAIGRLWQHVRHVEPPIPRAPHRAFVMSLDCGRYRLSVREDVQDDDEHRTMDYAGSAADVLLAVALPMAREIGDVIYAGRGSSSNVSDIAIHLLQDQHDNSVYSWHIGFAGGEARVDLLGNVGRVEWSRFALSEGRLIKVGDKPYKRAVEAVVARHAAGKAEGQPKEKTPPHV